MATYRLYSLYGTKGIGGEPDLTREEEFPTDDFARAAFIHFVMGLFINAYAVSFTIKKLVGEKEQTIL